MIGLGEAVLIAAICSVLGGGLVVVALAVLLLARRNERVSGGRREG
jgi:hypothetical protein